MWHVETFDSRGAPGEMETLLEQRLLPWFRSRGFVVHAFVTQASLGERQYWLATEMDSFADIDGWAERGGTEGAAIIADLLRLAVGIRASVIAEIGGLGMSEDGAKAAADSTSPDQCNVVSG